MPDKVTAKTLEHIRRRNAEGASDPQIARELGLSPPTVWKYRQQFKLPSNRTRGHPVKTYTVYNRRTSEYICEGTSFEIAELLGIKRQTVYSAISRSKRNIGGYKWYIVEVTEDE